MSFKVPQSFFQVSKLNTVCIKQEDASEDSAGTPELGAQDSPTQNLNQSLTSEGNPVKLEPMRTTVAGEGELSEISDSDDDILNKTDKVRPKSELPAEREQEMDTNGVEVTKNECLHGVAGHPIKGEEVDEVLDFEEISDGELEEDARHKGEQSASHERDIQLICRNAFISIRKAFSADDITSSTRL